MKFNRDGTRYQVETVIEAIEARCAKAAYPNLCDLLGSDWGWGYTYPASTAYKAFAIERAKELYSTHGDGGAFLGEES